jgi:shikimate kinase
MKKSTALPCNLFLIGFMGTGKSALAGCLNRQFGIKRIEMDDQIARREGMSIPEIFDKKGEEYFRDAETRFLRAMSRERGAVISCGGGAPLRSCNVQAMRENGKIVLLTATPETVRKRVSGNRSRPLLKGRDTAEAIGELMEQRRQAYEQAADLVIRTDGKTIEEIAGELMKLIRK